ncbi:unnamed protein product [Camellia sinensis]
MAGSVHSHGVGGGMADSKVYTPIRGRSGSGGRGGRGGRGQNPLALNPELNVVSTVDNAAPDKSWASISDLSCSVFLELPGVWSQQADPSQWSSTYYGYGQGYDAYGYGTTHDPSLYAYGAYPGYAQYPQQVYCFPALTTNLLVDSVVYLVDAYDKERFAEAKKELDALHKKEQQYSTLLTPDVLFF